MPAPTDLSAAPPDLQHARERGRSEGFAIAAVALGVLSFIQLLGAEKALLAVVLGILALRGAASPRARTQGRIAIALGAIYLAVTATALVLFRDQFAELIRLLQTLG